MPEPSFQFRGTWIPAELHYLVLEDKINPTEFLLLSIIDSLVNAKGDGCWASNAYLAKRVRVATRTIASIISGLKAKKLVKQTGWKRVNGRDFRILETAWSRCPAASTHEENLMGPVRNSSPRDQSLFHKDFKEENPLAAASGITNEGSSMPFFPEMTKEKKTTRFDQQWAYQLRETLTKIMRNQRWSMEKWADQFRLLRKDHWVGDVQTLLDWYAENATTIKKPTIHNAMNFRKCFSWLWESMEKDPTRIDVLPESKEIAKRLAKYHWPKGSAVHLAQAVDKTLSGFRLVKMTIKAWILPRLPVQIANNPIASVEKLAEHLAMRGGINPLTETERWFQDVFKRVCDWRDWNGNLMSEAFDGDFRHKRLTALGAHWAAKMGNAKNWNKLVEMV